MQPRTEAGRRAMGVPLDSGCERAADTGWAEGGRAVSAGVERGGLSEAGLIKEGLRDEGMVEEGSREVWMIEEALKTGGAERGGLLLLLLYSRYRS